MAGRISDSPSANASWPVFGFRSKRGKFDELTSSRIRCPFLKTFDVDHISILNSSTLPSVSIAGVVLELRHRARMIPSVRFNAVPHGLTSTSLAVKSVSCADDDAN